MQSISAVSKTNRRRKWDLVKDDIRKHYLQDGKTLKEVMTIISSHHNFDACERAYKARLKKWEFTTYRKTASPSATDRVKRRCKRRASNIARKPHEDQSALDMGFSSFQLAPWAPEFSDPALNPITYLPCHNSLHEAVIGQCMEDVIWYSHGGRCVRSRDKFGREPLHYAVVGGNPAIIRQLVKCGADIYAEEADFQRTPLEEALLRPASLSALLEDKIDVCKQNADGKSLLHLLCAFDLDICKGGATSFALLVDAGADVNQSDGYNSPFHMLLSKPITYDGSPTCILLKAALQAGAYPTGYHRSEGSTRYETPFEMFLNAAIWVDWREPGSESCLAEIFGIFLEKGANPNIRLRNGGLIFDFFWQVYTKSGKAIYHDILKLLLQKIDLSLAVADPHVWLGRFVRTRFPAVELMEIVLKRGCSVNVGTGSSKSSLAYVSHSSFLGEEIPVEETIARVKLLLKNGAETFWPIPLGKLPVVAFLEKNKAWADEVVSLILDADADNPNSDTTHLPRWYVGWRRAVKCRSWAPAAYELTFVDDKSWPFQNAIRLQRLALKTLAHRHLRVQRDRFSEKSIEYQQHEQEVNRIIQNCRDMKVDISEKWRVYAAVLFNQDSNPDH